VSSGWDQDVSINLWDLSTKQKVVTNSTSQLLHKPILAIAADHDIFAVAAHTSEIKFFKLGGMKEGCHASDAFYKLMTLSGHSKEVFYIAFDKDICTSISRD
jgi:hypothetical protein